MDDRYGTTNTRIFAYQKRKLKAPKKNVNILLAADQGGSPSKELCLWHPHQCNPFRHTGSSSMVRGRLVHLGHFDDTEQQNDHWHLIV